MNIETVLKYVKCPNEAKANTKLFKKTFYDNAKLTKAQKDLIKDDVKEIRWFYALKPDNTNIRAYKDEEVEYEEIQVIGTVLTKEKKISAISEVIQRAIPYPVILLLESDNRVNINVSFKRLNKGDASKDTIKQNLLSGWIGNEENSEKEKKFLESLKLNNLSFKNLYETYYDFTDRVKLFIACSHADKYTYKDRKTTSRLFGRVVKLQNEEEELKVLKNRVKKERIFASKVDLNVTIKEKKQKIEKLIDSINKEV